MGASAGGARRVFYWGRPRPVQLRFPRRVQPPALHRSSCRAPGAPPRPRRAPAAAMSQEPRAGRDEILEGQVMWEPDSKKITLMDRFRAAVGAACGLALGE